MTAPLLEASGLSKSFGALKVTDDISLDLRPGELHAIIGPNGAGKTTLIDQLSGRLPADRGSVHFDGSDITAITMADRVKRGLARTFQITSILEGFTVLENAALAVQARSGSSFRFFGRADREGDLNADALTA
ncbi:MAG: ATP-binding cassette domain-containing protein, partial [Geminicoccaceae bacterium]